MKQNKKITRDNVHSVVIIYVLLKNSETAQRKTGDLGF